LQRLRIQGIKINIFLLFHIFTEQNKMSNEIQHIDDDYLHCNHFKPLRVELLVVDNEGKEICKSIPPNVPSELKTN
jgi:hypothetical protein